MVARAFIHGQIENSLDGDFALNPSTAFQKMNVNADFNLPVWDCAGRTVRGAFGGRQCECGPRPTVSAALRGPIQASYIGKV
jgi:hypothetical protein